MANLEVVKLIKEAFMKFISPRAHTIIGFIVGIALVFAPNIFGFNDIGGASIIIPRVIGIIVILSELTVRGSFSGLGVVPMRAHIVMDVLMGAFLAISPWLFSFTDKGTNAWLPHLVVGIAMMGYALETRTNEEEARTHHAHPAH
jgi:hypothetical protein